MSVVATGSFTTSTGNGSVVAFPFTFAARSASEVRVTVNSVVQVTGYSVTLASDYNSGTVTFTTAPASSAAIMISSNPSFTQPITFVNAGNYNPAAIDGANDEAAIRDIFLKAIANRSIRAPLGETLGDMPAKTSRASMFLGFDASGNPVALSGTGGADINLRTDLAASSGAALVGWLPAVGLQAMDLQTALRLGLPLMPEHFGAVGNGIADDYTAFQALVAQINLQGGGRVMLAHGKTYLIGQHVVSGNGITDLHFLSCNGLLIEGNGAKIDLQGNFDRAASTTRALCMLFENCSNVVLRNYEIDGNVDQMTNSSSSAEPVSDGVLLRGCTDVLAYNVNSHHHSADGFRCDEYHGASVVACRRITLINCRSQFNARLAFSPIQVRNLTCLNCDFSQTGQSTGTYGNHAPTSGVDIEPNYTTASASPNTMDVNTGDILFDNCRFINNLGGPWKQSSAATASNDTVTFRNCRVEDTASVTDQQHIVLGGDNTVVDGCYIDMKDNKLLFCHTFGYGKFINNTVHGTNMLFESANANSNRILVADNEFICDNVGTYTHAGLPIQITSPGVIFRENRVFIPQAAWVTGGAGDGKQMVQLSGIRRSERNRFETTLTATFSGATTAHFYNSYGTTVVRDDQYVGTAVGAADTFRPISQSAFNSLGYFNCNHRLANTPGSVKPGDAAYTFLATESPSLIVYDVPITAARAISLDTTANKIFRGAKCRVVRLAACTGAFNLNIGTGPLKALGTAGTFADFEYDGSAWVETGSGSL